MRSDVSVTKEHAGNLVINDPYGLLTAEDIESARETWHREIDAICDAAIAGAREKSVSFASQTSTLIGHKEAKRKGLPI